MPRFIESSLKVESGLSMMATSCFWADPLGVSESKTSMGTMG